MRATMLLVAIIAAITTIASAEAAGGTLVVLMPGAGGAVPEDFLIRNRDAIAGAGVETTIATTAEKAEKAASAAHDAGRETVVVAMSRGALKAAEVLASDAPVSGVVFVSANYRGVVKTLGSLARLPPAVLGIHHVKDSCNYTRPQGARRFVGWSHGKASVTWIETTGKARGGPCGPFAAHGFFGKDEPAVAAIVGFLQRL